MAKDFIEIIRDIRGKQLTKELAREDLSCIYGEIAHMYDILHADEADFETIVENIPAMKYFADIYQGPKTEAPTLRNDDTALQSGDIYFNEVNDTTYIYSGGVWVSAVQSAVTKTSDTGAMKGPRGTTAERPLNPKDGYIRYNTDLQHTETFRESTGTWGTIGASQFLGKADVKAVLFTAQSTSENLVLKEGTNGLIVDSLTIENGGSITLENNTTLKVV